MGLSPGTPLTGCRCDQCRGAMYAYLHEWHQSHDIPEHVHGTNNGYKNHRCRCDRCRAAAAKYMRGLRARNRQKNA